MNSNESVDLVNSTDLQFHREPVRLDTKSNFGHGRSMSKLAVSLAMLSLAPQAAGMESFPSKKVNQQQAYLKLRKTKY